MIPSQAPVDKPKSAWVRAGQVLALFRSAQFLRFLVVGGIAAALHWLARYLLTPFTGYIPALIIAYVFGILVGYLLNAAFVFSKASNKRVQQVSYFVAFNILMAPVVIAVSYVLSEYVFVWLKLSYHPREVAHAIGVLSPVFINFLLHKLFTFRGG